MAISPQNLGAALPEIGTNHIDQLLRTGSLSRTASVFCVKDMKADVPFEHFRHEAIHGSTGGRNELQNIRTLLLGLESALNRFDLTGDAAHSLNQFCSFPNRMRH
jgi:hypothetical protein